ncbi:hypothetical protein [Actinomadura rugatobispora]|uniref:ISL3 family transposase n=1 Tax=Actinomadura rugatobispora TaxID=1994 RepID=A0ABW1AHL7_9ACTN|nr:hypothetical protein GCM10010200_084820 [Actinomadura rugatobispora]
MLVERLEYKIDPAFTLQRCLACGTRDVEARESQARFRVRVLRFRLQC